MAPARVTLPQIVAVPRLLVELANHGSTKNARDDRLAHHFALVDVLVVGTGQGVIGGR